MSNETRIAELEAQLAAAKRRARRWKRNSDLNLHRVLTCGVAARHPDENLTLTGAYFDKWNSQQAQEVRELRKDRDTLRAENATLRERLKTLVAAALNAAHQLDNLVALINGECPSLFNDDSGGTARYEAGSLDAIAAIVALAALDAGVQVNQPNAGSPR